MPPTLCCFWVDLGLHVGALWGNFRHFGLHFRSRRDVGFRMVLRTALLVDFGCDFGVHVGSLLASILG